MTEGKKPSKMDLSLSPAGEANGSSIPFLGDAYERWVENLFKISEEISHFAQNRIQRDIASWKKLAMCRDPGEFINCERVMAEEAMSQFAEDVFRISQLIAMATGNAYSSPKGGKQIIS